MHRRHRGHNDAEIHDKGGEDPVPESTDTSRIGFARRVATSGYISGMEERNLACGGKALRRPPTALALRDFYLGVGRLHQLNDAHDQLLAPKDWFLDGGKLVFLVENQAVVYWGVEAVQSPDDDPPIFRGVHLPERVSWLPDHDRCSEFLLVMLHWQAVNGGFQWLGMADAGQEVIDHFKKYWRLVGELQGLIAFRREGRAACLGCEANSWRLYVGGRSEEHFQQIAAELRSIGVGLNQL